MPLGFRLREVRRLRRGLTTLRTLRATIVLGLRRRRRVTRRLRLRGFATLAAATLRGRPTEALLRRRLRLFAIVFTFLRFGLALNPEGLWTRTILIVGFLPFRNLPLEKSRV